MVAAAAAAGREEGRGVRPRGGAAGAAAAAATAEATVAAVAAGPA